VETRRAETVNVFLREHDGEDRVEIQRFPGGALPSHEAV
jgi:hypothetical protein